MPDNEKETQQPEQAENERKPEDEAAVEPAAAEAAQDAPAEEPGDAPAEEPQAEPAQPEEPTGEAQPDQAAEGATAAAEPAAPAGEEDEPLTPKQRRKQERARASGPPAPSRSPEERSRERADVRRSNAVQRGRWRPKKRERERAARKEPSEAKVVGEPRPTGKRKVRQGVVVSSKADKTITVRIEHVRPHPVYGKIVRVSRTFHAHDERNQASEGDLVEVVESRPLSRTKRWRLLDVIQRAR
jgi:small subunit ribosomal protein S17